MNYSSTKNTLTVGELIQKLETFNKETKVLVYVDEVEEFGDVTSFQLLDPNSEDYEDECPYSKGDIPKTKEKFLLIKGTLI